MHHTIKEIANLSLLRIVGTVLLVLGLASCIPEPLELKDIPAVEPEIVVASQIIPDQSLLVLLTKTFSALEVETEVEADEFLRQIAVNDAVVTLTGPAGTDTLTFVENGLYRGADIPFREGETYELNVKSNTLGEVAASTRVLPVVNLKTAMVDLYYEGLADTLAAVSYGFNDPSGANWYLLNVQKLEREELHDVAIAPEAFTLLLSDEEMKEEDFESSFTYLPADYAPGDTVAVSLSNISKAYFDFMEMRTARRLSFLDFLSEPADYPSNVQGGKGFFNLYIPDVKLLVVEPQR